MAHDTKPQPHKESEWQTDTGARLNHLSDNYIVRLYVEGGRSAGAHPGGRPAASRADPVDLYLAGWSALAIAARLGCSPLTIDRRLDAAGVARRTVTPSISRHDLIEALDRGRSAP